MASTSMGCEFKPELILFGRIFRKEGTYSTFFSREFICHGVPNNHILIDGVLYEKPEVVLFFEDGHKKVYYFDNYNDAIKFRDNLTSEKNWI